jgi:hypothetical protein
MGEDFPELLTQVAEAAVAITPAVAQHRAATAVPELL